MNGDTLQHRMVLAKEKTIDITHSLFAKAQGECSTIEIKNNNKIVTVQIGIKGNWNVLRK